MNANVRRDLVLGGCVIVFGAGLLVFAFFAGDDSFRAPRWVVAAAAVAFIAGGIVPLRLALAHAQLPAAGTYANLAISGTFFVLSVWLTWVVVAVGPEGANVLLDVPLPISESAERIVRGAIFYGLFGGAAFACFVISMRRLNRALPALGRTTFVAIVAPVTGLMAWVAIEIQGETVPIYPPVMKLTFDQRFPGDGYVVRPVGKEIVAKPGHHGMGLFVGGNGDWIDVDAPPGFDTLHGLTLELWMRRENWVNPYNKGAQLQQVASIDVERDWEGRPELRQIAFAMELSLPRERLGAALADNYVFRPQVRMGETRIAPSRALSIAAQRWTHVAVVYDRFLVDRVKLYVDGRQVARGMPWGAAPGYAMIRAVRIGTMSERNGAYRGMVDEVKIYARALGEEEIAAEAASRS